MEVHRTPEVSSTERMHVMDRNCWCQPQVEVDIGGTMISHRSAEETGIVGVSLNLEACLEPYYPQPNDSVLEQLACGRKRGHSGNHAAVHESWIVEWDGLGWAVGRQPVPQWATADSAFVQ